MVHKLISELHENPNNRRNIDEVNYDRLVKQMRMGDHSTWLITEDGMIVDGNMRKKAAVDAGWESVDCKVLSFQKDEEKGYFALIDGVIVKDHEVIPYYYKTIEDGIMAYALSRNGTSGYYNDDIFNDMPQMEIDWSMFPIDISPPKDIEEIIKSMAQSERKKKLMLIISCDDQEQLEQRYLKIVELGIPVKKKV
jgi:hypothetical protein